MDRRKESGGIFEERAMEILEINDYEILKRGNGVTSYDIIVRRKWDNKIFLVEVKSRDYWAQDVKFYLDIKKLVRLNSKKIPIIIFFINSVNYCYFELNNFNTDLLEPVDGYKYD